MDKTQVLNLFALYTAAYPLAEINKEQIALWINMLSDVPYDRGLKNMEKHIKASHFPPTIADIRKNNESWMNGDMLTVEETHAMLAEQEEHRKRAVPMPEHIRLHFEKKKLALPRGDAE